MQELPFVMRKSSPTSKPVSRKQVVRTNKKMVDIMKQSATELAKAIPRKMKKSESVHAVLLATRYGGS